MEIIEITNNKEKQQFEYQIEETIAKLEYRFHRNNMALMHTEVPKSMEGKGVGSALVKYAFNYAEQHNKKVMVYCSFVAAYVKRHPELESQVDKTDHRK